GAASLRRLLGNAACRAVSVGIGALVLQRGTWPRSQNGLGNQSHFSGSCRNADTSAAWGTAIGSRQLRLAVDENSTGQRTLGLCSAAARVGAAAAAIPFLACRRPHRVALLPELRMELLPQSRYRHRILGSQLLRHTTCDRVALRPAQDSAAHSRRHRARFPNHESSATRVADDLL